MTDNARNHDAACHCCRKDLVCHVCGTPVKRTPFAVQGESRCTSGACLKCCATNHKHPRG